MRRGPRSCPRVSEMISANTSRNKLLTALQLMNTVLASRRSSVAIETFRFIAAHSGADNTRPEASHLQSSIFERHT